MGRKPTYQNDKEQEALYSQRFAKLSPSTGAAAAALDRAIKERLPQCSPYHRKTSDRLPGKAVADKWAKARRKMFLMLVTQPDDDAQEVRIHMKPEDWPSTGDLVPIRESTRGVGENEVLVKHFYLRDVADVPKLMGLIARAHAVIN